MPVLRGSPWVVGVVPMIDKTYGLRKGHCMYYTLPVSVIESPDFPFRCERMTAVGECDPHCEQYTMLPVRAPPRGGIPHAQ